MEPISAVAVPFVIPPRLASIRSRSDRAAALGAGPHVTVLFPFVAVSALDAGVHAELARIAAAVEPFGARFSQVRRFDGVVWIEPDDPAPFRSLTAAVVAHWPDHPPYGGLFDEVIHHLTIVESETAPLATIEADARAIGPFIAVADRLELWCQDASERWTPHWAMPFGVRP